MKNKNTELTILKSLGILVVVSCHLGVNLFNFIGMPLTFKRELFPEYSYHMPLFIFASGYFYKRIYEKDILNLVKRRLSSIKKYISCNIFYFVLTLILASLGLLSMKLQLNLKGLLIEPFLGGFQFYFNGPGWFVPFLFLLQITYVALRKVLGIVFRNFNNKNTSTLKQETILLVGLVFVGFIATSISNAYPVVDGNVSIFQSFLRVLFGLPFFQIGFMFKAFLESNLKLTLTTFILVVVSKLLIDIHFGYYTFSLRTIKFNNRAILPFIVAILGILYLLHLTKFIVNVVGKASPKTIDFLCIIGNNTWSIMMHHLLIKWFLNGLYNLHFVSDNFMYFGKYFINPILCVLLPLSYKYLYDYIEGKYKSYKKNKLVVN